MRRRAKVYRHYFRTGASYRSYESSAARCLWFCDDFLRTRTRAGTADGADSRTAPTDVFGVGPATLTLDGTWVTRVPLLGPLERFYGVANGEFGPYTSFGTVSGPAAARRTNTTLRRASTTTPKGLPGYLTLFPRPRARPPARRRLNTDANCAR